MNYVPSGVLTRSLLPDISPLPAGLFSTSMGLSWYHARIAPFPASLFSTPMGFPCIKILSIWKSIGTRAC